METQSLLMLLLSVIVGGLGYFLRVMWAKIESFVHKEDFNRFIDLLMKRFDRLEDKLDQKQDK